MFDADTVMNFAFFVGKCVFWYFVADFIFALVFKKVAAAPEASVPTIADAIAKSIHPVKVENHEGVTYWFFEKNDAFLAQGKDQDEIAKILRARFPLYVFVADGNAYLGPDFKAAPLDLDAIAEHFYKNQERMIPRVKS